MRENANFAIKQNIVVYSVVILSKKMLQIENKNFEVQEPKLLKVMQIKEDLELNVIKIN